MRSFRFCRAVYAAALCLSTLPVFAHGTEVSLRKTGGPGDAVVAAFSYSTGEAMSYAKIKLYAPDGREVLSSVSDRNGLAVFVPDETGVWVVAAEDGMGHKASLNVTVDEQKNGGAAESDTPGGGIAKTPKALRVILGLSLLLNIFCVWALLRGGKVAH